MLFDTDQLEVYRETGYVIVDRPFPADLTARYKRSSAS